MTLITTRPRNLQANAGRSTRSKEYTDPRVIFPDIEIEDRAERGRGYSFNGIFLLV